jgi:hypothetical protein
MYLGLWWLSGRFDRQGEITSDPLFYVLRRAICPGMSVASTSLPVFRRRFLDLDLITPLATRQLDLNGGAILDE